MATQIMQRPGLGSDRPEVKNISRVFVIFLLCCFSMCVIFHCVEMKDRSTQLTAARKRLLQQMPDLSTVLPGSLLSRMVRCNKPGCRFCEKGKGKGHGPIWILSVSLGNRQVRQVPILRRFREMIQVCFPKLTLGKLQLVRRQRPSRQVVGCRVVCTTMRSACL